MSNKSRITVILAWKAILHIFFFLSLEKDFLFYYLSTDYKYYSNRHNICSMGSSAQHTESTPQMLALLEKMIILSSQKYFIVFRIHFQMTYTALKFSYRTWLWAQF